MRSGPGLFRLARFYCSGKFSLGFILVMESTISKRRPQKLLNDHGYFLSFAAGLCRVYSKSSRDHIGVTCDDSKSSRDHVCVPCDYSKSSRDHVLVPCFTDENKTMKIIF